MKGGGRKEEKRNHTDFLNGGAPKAQDTIRGMDHIANLFPLNVLSGYPEYLLIGNAVSTLGVYVE